MTEITQSEIKMIYLQIVMMAILGIFLFLYTQQPISQQYNIDSKATSATSVSSKDASWISNLMSADAGFGGMLPNGVADILIVSTIFLIPLTIMNAITLIRFAKDLATQWI